VAIATLKCYDTLNFLTACKGTVTTVSFLGGTAGRCDDSGHQFTTTTVAKTATIPMNFYGITKLGATTLTTGKVFFNDTAKCSTYTQNTADSVKAYKTLLVTGNAVFNGGYYIPSFRTSIGGDIDVTAGYCVFQRDSCGGDFTITNPGNTIFDSGDTTFIGLNLTTGLGANVTNTGHFKRFLSGASHTITTNAIGLPTVLLGGNTAINGGCTIARMIIDDNIRATMQSGESYTLTAIATTDWKGSVNKVTEVYSSVLGTRFNLAIPAIITIDSTCIRDCNSSKVITLGTLHGGGNNINVKYTTYDKVVIDRWFKQDDTIRCNYITFTNISEIGRASCRERV
jgi:hypothetical protein